MLYVIEEELTCCCSYFTIVFGIFPVTVADSTHLCVVCRHFLCFTLLFQEYPRETFKIRLSPNQSLILLLFEKSRNLYFSTLQCMIDKQKQQF